MQALRSLGHEAEIVAIPFKWYPPERILAQVLACRLLDLSESGGSPIARVIGLKFPVYLIPTGTKFSYSYTNFAPLTICGIILLVTSTATPMVHRYGKPSSGSTRVSFPKQRPFLRSPRTSLVASGTTVALILCRFLIPRHRPRCSTARRLRILSSTRVG
jgi:hypothetical protein